MDACSQAQEHTRHTNNQNFQHPHAHPQNSTLKVITSRDRKADICPSSQIEILQRPN
eukprot:c39673_g1_i1 orf=34-204(+)